MALRLSPANSLNPFGMGRYSATSKFTRRVVIRSMSLRNFPNGGPWCNLFNFLFGSDPPKEKLMAMASIATAQARMSEIEP